MDSRIPGLYDLPPAERLDTMTEACDLSTDAREALETTAFPETADDTSGFHAGDSLRSDSISEQTALLNRC